jgi:hypothetical protein
MYVVLINLSLKVRFVLQFIANIIEFFYLANGLISILIIDIILFNIIEGFACKYFSDVRIYFKISTLLSLLHSLIFGNLSKKFKINIG